MLVDEVRADPARALEREDEFQRALAENYVKLARAVVALAAIDLIACRYRMTALKYIRRWYTSEHGHVVTDDGLREWCNKQEQHIRQYLANDGGELARWLGCYHYVRLASQSRLSGKRLRTAMRMHMGRASRNLDSSG